jgi:hypothetical protein
MEENNQTHGIVIRADADGSSFHVYHCHAGGHNDDTVTCGDCCRIGGITYNGHDTLAELEFYAYHGYSTTLLGTYRTLYRAALAIAVAAENEYIADTFGE